MIESRYYGEFGGTYIPEILVSTLDQLITSFKEAKEASDMNQNDIVLVNQSGYHYCRCVSRPWMAEVYTEKGGGIQCLSHTLETN